MDYVQIIADVQGMPRQELLVRVRAWQAALGRPTRKQVAAWDRCTDEQLQGRVVRLLAHERGTTGPLDWAGRVRVNAELEGSGLLRWTGRTPAWGHWVPATQG